jgi:hypothetical protein
MGQMTVAMMLGAEVPPSLDAFVDKWCAGPGKKKPVFVNEQGPKRIAGVYLMCWGELEAMRVTDVSSKVMRLREVEGSAMHKKALERWGDFMKWAKTEGFDQPLLWGELWLVPVEVA